MRSRARGFKLWLWCVTALPLFFVASAIAVGQCGQTANQTCSLTGDRLLSVPSDLNSASPNPAALEKGKRPGLLFKFLCADSSQLDRRFKKNVCFPIKVPTTLMKLLSS
jgi:hypothetical protein